MSPAFAHGRDFQLTPRQREILSRVASGLGDKQIAVALGMSVHTVRSHLDRLFKEHGLHNRASAVAAWLVSRQEAGAVAPPASEGPPPVAQ